MDERMYVYPVQNFVAECRVDGCTWRQKHTARTDAELDAEHHLSEWHGRSSESSIAHLLDALDASLAAARKALS